MGKIKKNRLRIKRLIVFIIFGLLIFIYFLIFINSFLHNGKITSKRLPLDRYTSVKRVVIPDSKKLKTFKDSYFKIKFDIPENWTINGFDNAKGYKDFKFTSEDYLVSIGTVFDHDRKLEYGENLPNLDIILGENKDFTYSKYYTINFIKDNEVVYIINFDNKYRQKDLKLYLVIKNGYKENLQRVKNVLQTFDFTEQEPRIDSLIDFEIPEGWYLQTKNSYGKEYDPSEKITLHSNDVEIYENSGYLTKGAQIIIHSSEVVSNEKEDESKLAPHTILIIGGYKARNFYRCWEGCIDSYSIKTENFKFTINFMCANVCDTKVEADQSYYAKGRDQLLNSILFK